MENKEFEKLLNAERESEHLEFKEAKNQFNFNEGKKSLCGYSVALANEKGGKLILGVTDKIPRKVIGTTAFEDLGKIKRKIYEKFHRTISSEEFNYEGKRIIIFEIPSRPIGEPMEFEGQFLMREGENLLPMTAERHQKITKEFVHDFSAEMCNEAKLEEDIDKKKYPKTKNIIKSIKKS
jgi:ATP-dependent DNA helicase RecG